MTAFCAKLLNSYLYFNEKVAHRVILYIPNQIEKIDEALLQKI